MIVVVMIVLIVLEVCLCVAAEGHIWWRREAWEQGERVRLYKYDMERLVRERDSLAARNRCLENRLSSIAEIAAPTQASFTINKT